MKIPKKSHKTAWRKNRKKYGEKHEYTKKWKQIAYANTYILDYKTPNDVLMMYETKWNENFDSFMQRIILKKTMSMM